MIETVIGRFEGLVDEVRRCMATDLDLAAVESDLDSRGMVVELAMLDSPEFTGGDEVAVAHHVGLESARGIRRIQAANARAGSLRTPAFLRRGAIPRLGL